MKKRKKRAARVHSQSDAPLVATGNQGEAPEEALSPHSALDPGRPALHMISLPGVQLASPSVDLATTVD